MDNNNVVGIEMGKCVRFKLKVKIVQEIMVWDINGTMFSFFLHFLLDFFGFLKSLSFQFIHLQFHVFLHSKRCICNCSFFFLLRMFHTLCYLKLSIKHVLFVYISLNCVLMMINYKCIFVWLNKCMGMMPILKQQSLLQHDQFIPSNPTP